MARFVGFCGWTEREDKSMPLIFSIRGLWEAKLAFRNLIIARRLLLL